MRRAGAPSPQQRFYNRDPTDQRTWRFYLKPRMIAFMIGPLFILGLFVWGTWTVTWVYLLQQLAETSSLAYLWILIFNGPMVLATISLFKTTFTDPGSVPKGFDDDVIVRERTPKGEMRFCKACNNLKPDRAHHCSMSGHCVLKMDHFCPWVGNTVGFRNYKFFILFLFYTVWTCWLAFLISIGATVRYMGAVEIEGEEINHIVATFVSAMFALVLSIFLGQHISLVLSNLTTLESMDRNRIKNNAYNLGSKRNWIQVFGHDRLMWFSPTITALGDGIEWEINVDERAMTAMPATGRIADDHLVPLDSMESMESMEMMGRRGDHMV